MQPRSRFGVASYGISVLSSWMMGGTLALSGHDIYKELAPYRLPGGKHATADLAEFHGDVVIEFSELQLPLKDVVKHCFSEWAVTTTVAGDVFDFNAVLENFNWQMSKTNHS